MNSWIWNQKNVGISLFGVLIFSALAGPLKEEDLATEGLDGQWLKTIVSIEFKAGTNASAPIGTGFLLGTTNFANILVTAKHVVEPYLSQSNSTLCYRVNDKAGNGQLILEEQLRAAGIGDWFLSSSNDVACRYLAFSFPSDVLSLPFSMLLTHKRVRPGAQIIVGGFPMGLRSEEHCVAVLRRGIVARCEDNNILVDAALYPGNSGGPVVYVPLLKLNPNQFAVPHIANDKLIGLVSSGLPYVHPEQKVAANVSSYRSIEYSGLCNVTTADSILDLVTRDDVRHLELKLLPIVKRH